MALGEQVAVFRGQDGKAYVLDAYCPHLGANLAVGGRVVGSCIECPFHGWQFRGNDGKCTKIPYAEKGMNWRWCPVSFIIQKACSRYNFFKNPVLPCLNVWYLDWVFNSNSKTKQHNDVQLTKLLHIHQKVHIIELFMSVSIKTKNKILMLLLFWASSVQCKVCPEGGATGHLVTDVSCLTKRCKYFLWKNWK